MLDFWLLFFLPSHRNQRHHLQIPECCLAFNLKSIFNLYKMQLGIFALTVLASKPRRKSFESIDIRSRTAKQSWWFQQGTLQLNFSRFRVLQTSRNFYHSTTPSTGKKCPHCYLNFFRSSTQSFRKYFEVRFLCILGWKNIFGHKNWLLTGVFLNCSFLGWMNSGERSKRIDQESPQDL